MSSFARFENMTMCKTEMTELGHTDKDATHICTDIKDRAEKGILYKATPQGLAVLSKATDPDLVIGGYASWELVDPERDIITTQAQSKGLQRFFKQAPEYQSITVNHKEFKLAQPILKYADSEGHEYFSHVNEKGTYLISKLRNDNLKTTQTFREKARNGDFTHYSISGSPLQTQVVKAEDGLDARRVDDIEYWAITLCEKGVVQAVNPKAAVSLISKSKEEEKMKEKIEKATVEEIEKDLLDKYRERSALEKVLYPPVTEAKVSEPSVTQTPPIPQAPDPLLEVAKQEMRQKLDILRIEIWALEEALKQKIIAANKAVLPVQIQKTVEKRGDQWCVVHCHGEQAGEAIKCFDTKEEADAMHAAIQANKALDFKIEAELILQKYGFNKVK